MAKGGRDGHVHSSDGLIDLEIRKPRELDGQGGGTNHCTIPIRNYDDL